jgi:hypothetical protein
MKIQYKIMTLDCKLQVNLDNSDSYTLDRIVILSPGFIPRGFCYGCRKVASVTFYLTLFRRIDHLNLYVDNLLGIESRMFFH